MDKNEQTVDLEPLIQEYSEQRASFKQMITELNQLKDKVNILFPESATSRYARFFDEKLKSITELFKAILEIRKEISKNIKDEIEMRRRLQASATDEDEFDGDVRSLAKLVEEQLKGNKNTDNVVSMVKSSQTEESKKEKPNVG